MTAISLAQTSVGSRAIRTVSRRILLLAGLVLLGDWLFFSPQYGVSIAIFYAALAIAVFLANRLDDQSRPWLALIVLVIALLPVMEDLSALSFCLAGIGTAAAALIAVGDFGGGFSARSWAIVRLLLGGPLQALLDGFKAPRLWSRLGGIAFNFGLLVRWIVPLASAAVFALLFLSANPLLDYWLSQIQAPRATIEPDRIILWGMLGIAAWPFLRLKAARLRRQKVVPVTPAVVARPASEIFGEAAILRSLMIFNLLFGVQTLLDITYLWGGVALPAGMTYADYAHRGAYPLMITALLAAGFVLSALREGQAAEHSRLIRILIVIWLGQNILLVVSSMLRLDLYVAVYSLTYLRFAAFVWMLLVAVGLVLILVRMMLHKPNGWLFGANLCSLGVALYACCMLNLPYLIARYNLMHCREISGEGTVLDFRYLDSLGLWALPAIEEALALQDAKNNRELHADFHDALLGRRYRLQAAVDPSLRDWRSWSFRAERLRRYRSGEVSTTPATRDDRS